MQITTGPDYAKSKSEQRGTFMRFFPAACLAKSFFFRLTAGRT